MKSRIIALLVLLTVSCVVAPFHLHAAGNFSFGPQKCAIGNWRLHLSHHTFNVQRPGDGIVTVTKITPDIHLRGGFILLNFQFIPLRDVLTGDAEVVHLKAALESANTLIVFLRGSPKASVSIEVQGMAATTQPPQGTVSVLPTSINTGDSATLTWETADADSVVIDNGIGSVATSGSRVVAPSETTTYTLTATGPGGKTTATSTVTVLQAPQVSLTVDRPTISAGESTTLSWEAVHAQTIFIDQGIGQVDPIGSKMVSPPESSVYTITAQGPGGAATAQASVSVVPAPPRVAAYADLENILPGESTTLTWETTHADSCFIEPDIGQVDLSGSVHVTPSLSTVYTITAHGSGQSAIARVAITVHNQTVDIINTIAGTGIEGYSGDGGPAVKAEMGEIADMAMDRAGNLYLADVDNRCIRKVSPNGIITTVAGGGSSDDFGDGGPATSARLSKPAGIAFDASGNLYIADAWAYNIRRINPDGIISTFAGPELAGRHPADIVFDNLGNLYVSATNDHQIRRIDPSGTESIIVAGSGNVGFSGDGGPAIHARLDHPNGLALDEAGNLYVADSENRRIRKIDMDGIITTICGSDAYSGFVDVPGPAVEAGLGRPEKIMFDRNARLYIVDSSTSRVKRVDAHGVISTVAGKGLYHPAKQTGDVGPPRRGAAGFSESHLCPGQWSLVCLRDPLPTHSESGPTLSISGFDHVYNRWCHPPLGDCPAKRPGRTGCGRHGEWGPGNGDRRHIPGGRPRGGWVESVDCRGDDQTAA